MRALVTGGAGFIGSSLVDRLLRDGWDVEIIDDLSTGRMSNLPVGQLIHNLSISEMHENYNGSLASLCARCDVIFHLAAIVGVTNVLLHPKLTVERNTRETAIMLGYASANNTPILIASSSEVYGRRQDDRPLSEDMDLHIGPELRWGYAAGKLADEFLARAHHQESGLPVVVARLFNTVGPRQVGDYGMVMPRMIDAALFGTPITVTGTGIQRRAFAWIDPTVDALIRLIQEPNAYGKIVNVGATTDMSIQTLAVFIQRVVAKATGIQAKIVYAGYDANFADIQYRMPDLARLRSLIGDLPSMHIEDMIDTLVEYRVNRLTRKILS